MQQNIDFLVSVIGTERLSRKDVMERIEDMRNDKGNPYTRQTVHYWLRLARGQGLLDRYRVVTGQVWEYIYLSLYLTPAVKFGIC